MLWGIRGERLEQVQQFLYLLRVRLLPWALTGTDVASWLDQIAAISSVGHVNPDVVDRRAEGIRIGKGGEFLPKDTQSVQNLTHLCLGGRYTL